MMEMENRDARRKRAVLMCAGDYEQMEILRGGRGPACSEPGEPGGHSAVSYMPQDQALSAAEKPSNDFVVAVDGGLLHLLDQGIEPDLVLGDFDSLPEKLRPYVAALERSHPERILRLPCEKDDTDTVYAARVCLERGYREILFYGALGGRLDHTFANVQTLAWLKKRGADGYLLGKNTLVSVLCAETVLLPEDFEGVFSLFALDECLTGVTITGMKYPLRDAELTNSFPLGVSNEVLPRKIDSGGPGRAQVSVRSGLALMVLQDARGGAAPDPDQMERRPL